MKFLIVSAVLAAATISSSSIVKSSSDGNFELLILHNNDMHARFEQTSQLSGICTTADREAGKCYGGFPRVAHVVKEAREAAAAGKGPPVLYLNAGDTYTGTAWFTLYKWQIAAEFVNALKPDAVSLGNHEFDEAVDGVIPFIRNLTCPVLAANIILDKVPEMRNEYNLHDSIVINKNGHDIGIIGYLTPDTKYLAPKNKVEYEDEVVAIRREAKKLKEKGVNILIALGHSGFVKDLAIAENVEDIDLVIGGHSNTFLLNSVTDEKPECPEGPYPVLVTQPSGRKVPVVQAYAYTKYIGRLLLTFDSKGEIIHQSGTSILLDQNVPKDDDVLHMVEYYQGEINSKYNQIVGTSKAMLDGVTCRLRECNIGSFITNAMLHDNGVDASIAVIQGGRIRSSIEKSGKIPFEMTLGDWLTVLPFSDSLSLVTMNGSVLMQALEHSVSTWRPIDSTGQFLQFSGVTIVYDLAKKPGSRVIDVNATCSNCRLSGQVKVEEHYEYKVMMPSFLANGGDGYQMFENLPFETLENNELISVMSYLKKNQVINPQITGRIKILNEDKIVDVPSMKTTSDVCKYTPSSAVKTSASANLCMSVICLLTYQIVSL